MSSTESNSTVRTIKDGLKKSLGIYLAPLSPEERKLVSQYAIEKFDSVFPFRKLSSDADVISVGKEEEPKFATPAQTGVTYGMSTSWGGINFHSYYRVSTESFVCDVVLVFLQRHLLSNIDERDIEDLRFCPNAVTGMLGSPDFAVGGRGFGKDPSKKDNTYTSFFFRTRKMHEFKRIFLPVNLDNSHYVGAIVHPSDNKVCTFDHYGLSASSHERVFSMVESMLNHALQRDGQSSGHPGWTHVKLDVPKQSDTISCGILQIVNGTILTLFDDPKTARDMLVTQEQIVNLIRPKLRASILTHYKINYTPDQMVDHFKIRKKALELFTTKTLPIEIDPKLEEVYKKQLLDDHGHMFPPLLHDTPLSAIKACFRPQSIQNGTAANNIYDLTRAFTIYHKMSNTNFARLLCLKQMITNLFSKFNAEHDKAYLPILAHYLVDSFTQILRASLILDNGKLIVAKDRTSYSIHYTDLLGDDWQKATAKYPHLDKKLAQKRPKDDCNWFKTLMGWHDKMFDCARSVKDTVESLMKQMERSMNITINKDQVACSYCAADGQVRILTKQINNFSQTSNEFRFEESSYPERDFHWFSYRLLQLKRFQLLCKKARLPFPDLLFNDTLDQLHRAMGGTAVEDVKMAAKVVQKSITKRTAVEDVEMAAKVGQKSITKRRRIIEETDSEDEVETISEGLDVKKPAKDNVKPPNDNEPPKRRRNATVAEQPKVEAKKAPEEVPPKDNVATVDGQQPPKRRKKATVAEQQKVEEKQVVVEQKRPVATVAEQQKVEEKHHTSKNDSSAKRPVTSPRKSDRVVVKTMGTVGTVKLDCQFLNHSKKSQRTNTTSEVIDCVTYTTTKKGDEILIDMATPSESPSKNGQQGETVPPQEIADEQPISLAVVKGSTQTNIAVRYEGTRRDDDNDVKVDIFKKIGKACYKLAKEVERIPNLREDGNIFKSLCMSPAMNFIIRETDNVELVDHVNNNEAKANVMVRVKFPSYEEHDLLRAMKRQLDCKDYNAVVDVAKKDRDSGLVLIAFVSTYYAKSTSSRQDSVEELIFHSFILMPKPSDDDGNAMKIVFAWASEEYSGVSHERLMQIACICFWKEPIALDVKKPNDDAGLVPSKLEWFSRVETFLDILVRLCGARPKPLSVPNPKWCNGAMSKSIHVQSDMIANLGHLLKDVSSVNIPLAFFTHFLSTGLHITELAAELLQTAVITLDSNTPLENNGNSTAAQYVLHCNCCGDAMNSPLCFDDMISLATRTILLHNFNCDIDDDILHPYWSHLGNIRKDDVPKDFEVFLCRPTNDNNYERRMLLYDAIRVDNGHNPKELDTLRCNTVGITSALLPTQVTAGSRSDHPIVESIYQFIARMRCNPKDSSMKYDAAHVMIKDLQQIRDRPLQLNLVDIRINNISSFKPHDSWSIGDVDKLPLERQEIAKYTGRKTIEVGGVKTADKTVAVYTPKDNKGDQVLHMLSYYYAKSIIRISRGSTFEALKQQYKKRIRLPGNLGDFLSNHTITTTCLVVITDCPRKLNTNARFTPGGLLNDKMMSNLSWFVPSDYFLSLFPKQEIDDLFQGKANLLTISSSIRKALQDPIDKCMRRQISSLRLRSVTPHYVFEVGLASQSGKVFINARDEQNISGIQEPWYEDRLSSICHSSGSYCVTFGVGKKEVGNVNSLTEQEGTNLWIDKRNKDSNCAAGASCNWLHAVGLSEEASQIKAWAMSRNIIKSDERSIMKETLLYMQNSLYIDSVKINFLKGNLSLKEIVSVFSDFPAPCILELSCWSSYQAHAVVVCDKIVYDLQDSSPYMLTENCLTRKLNGDRDIITLVGAHYFINSKKNRQIPHCPFMPLKREDVPNYAKFLRSLGDDLKKKKKKKKKKNSNASL